MKTLFISLALLASCASNSEKKFRKLLDQGKCEEASINIPLFEVNKASSKLQSYTGRTISYILTGAAYGVDSIYFVAGGIILPTIVCGPLIILSDRLGTASNTHYKSKGGEKCFESVHNKTQKYDIFENRKNFGKEVYNKTLKQRCPNFDFAVKPIIEIADCYHKTGDIKKSMDQLQILFSEEAMGGCIDSYHKQKIGEKIDSLPKS